MVYYWEKRRRNAAFSEYPRGDRGSNRAVIFPDQLDSRTSKSVQVYELLRIAIISLEMPPDSAVVEKDICAQLGISRTPLREAILQLAKESLIKIAPSDGTFVNKIIIREVLQGQLVRDTIEMRLTKLAARNFKREYEKTLN